MMVPMKLEECATSEATVAVDEFRAAMRQLAAGVSIVTSLAESGRRGMTATAVCSLAADPPTLLVCINRNTETHSTITQSGRFCVNVLGAEHQELALRFSGREGVKGEQRFDSGEWNALRTGAPALHSALAVFDCRKVNALDWATHTIFIGTVIATRLEAARTGLVYRAGSFSNV